ncbi:MAG: hypothetical protein L0H53_15405 [Candidatus Nitrosocosmicus sp.]|nr:hypothetical protein [Candidatus Nitrosocosmicus sp.]
MSVVDTICIIKKGKEVKKIETGVKTNQQQHHNDCVGDIDGSYNNRDTDACSYVFVDIGKRNYVAL